MSPPLTARRRQRRRLSHLWAESGATACAEPPRDALSCRAPEQQQPSPDGDDAAARPASRQRTPAVRGPRSREEAGRESG